MENTSNITYKFSCEKCKFFCVKKGDYNRHINTKKHKNNLKDEERLNEYRCNCGKIYKHHSSLWNHKKKCKPKEEDQYKIPIISQELVMEILKQNDDLKNLLVEQNKEKIKQKKQKAESKPNH